MPMVISLIGQNHVLIRSLSISSLSLSTIPISVREARVFLAWMTLRLLSIQIFITSRYLTGCVSAMICFSSSIIYLSPVSDCAVIGDGSEFVQSTSIGIENPLSDGSKFRHSGDRYGSVLD